MNLSTKMFAQKQIMHENNKHEKCEVAYLKCNKNSLPE